MSIDGYLKEGVSVDSQPCFGSLVTISTIDGDIGMIEREFSLLVEKAVNNHDRLQQENAALKEANAWHVNHTKDLHEENAELRDGLLVIKQMIFSMKVNSHTFSNENVEEISKEGRAAMLLIENLLNKND